MPLHAQTRSTVLLACTPQSRARLYPLLAGIADVVTASTLEEALQRLAAGPALIVCSMKFDDSRMLDLAAEASRRYPHIPFVCCRASESELPSASLHAVHAAASNVGVVEFFDLFEAAGELGPEHAADLFRECVARHVGKPEASRPRPGIPSAAPPASGPPA